MNPQISWPTNKHQAHALLSQILSYQNNWEFLIHWVCTEPVKDWRSCMHWESKIYKINWGKKLVQVESSIVQPQKYHRGMCKNSLSRLNFPEFSGFPFITWLITVRIFNLNMLLITCSSNWSFQDVVSKFPHYTAGCHHSSTSLSLLLTWVNNSIDH